MSSERHVAHPNPAQYWKIAFLLAVLTAVEVAMFYINQASDLGILNAAVLLALAFLKFVIVVGWFMHLRYEKATLTRFFTGGFILAMSLYVIVFAAMGALAIRGG